MLLMALRHNVTDDTADHYWADMGLSASDLLPFDLFFDWWTSDVGRAAYTPPTLRDRSPQRSVHGRK
jgi:hypothetical protein